MRSYAGMMENALVQAETRAKQVGAALARDTAGQAQQALAQIERLREEAQAHTARAVGDLKGSFETVITQIGRQLEQMRGQFDNTSRGMRDAARKTATDLDQLRQEMQRRMESLPQQTAQATAAIRKALTDQLKEIEAMTPVLNRAQRGQPATAPSLPAGQLPPRSACRRSEEFAPLANTMRRRCPSSMRRGARSRRHRKIGSDLDSVANSLAQQLSGATHSTAAAGRTAASKASRSASGASPTAAARRWSVGDLLARASTQSSRPSPRRRTGRTPATALAAIWRAQPQPAGQPRLAAR